MQTETISYKLKFNNLAHNERTAIFWFAVYCTEQCALEQLLSPWKESFNATIEMTAIETAGVVSRSAFRNMFSQGGYVRNRPHMAIYGLPAR